MLTADGSVAHKMRPNAPKGAKVNCLRRFDVVRKRSLSQVESK